MTLLPIKVYRQELAALPPLLPGETIETELGLELAQAGSNLRKILSRASERYEGENIDSIVAAQNRFQTHRRANTKGFWDSGFALALLLLPANSLSTLKSTEKPYSDRTGY